MHRKFHAIELDSCQRDNGSDRIAWKLNLNKYETRSNGLAKWQRGSASDRKNTDLITKKSLSQRLSCKAIPPNFQTLTSGAIYTSSLSIMAAYYRQEIQAPSWPKKILLENPGNVQRRVTESYCYLTEVADKLVESYRSKSIPWLITLMRET